MFKICIFGVFLLATSNAFAIKYYQSDAGNIKTIDESTFNSCGIKVFRSSAKDQLSKANQKLLVMATLKGQAKNSVESAKLALKENSGACTYAEDSEKL